MERLVLILCSCAISSISTQILEFKTKKWTLPATFPGAPPIKFINVGESFDISCDTNDPFSNVELQVSPGITEDSYVSAVKRSEGRITVVGQTFVVSKVAADDEGRYKCMARSGTSNIELFKGVLSVRVPAGRKIIPTITPNTENSILNIKRGSDVKFNCASSRLPGSKLSYLKWYHSTDQGDIPIKSLPIKKDSVTTDGAIKFSVTTEKKTVDIEVLSIKGFAEKDIGEYVCKREVPDGYTTFSKVSVFMEGFCYFYDQLHTVGVSFVSSSCTAQCTCEESNAISCVSLCPPHYVICPPKQMEVAVPVKVSETPKCSCARKQCVSLTGHCYFEDKLYTKGQSFVSKGCASCKCNGFNSIECVSLCPPTKIRCIKGHMEHYVAKEESPGCYCRKPICLSLKNVCKMKSDAGPCYALFSRWHYDDATSTCQKFDYGGCEGNPNRFLERSSCENTCNPDSGKKKITAKGDCTFEGKWYRVGEHFVSTNCKSNCTCAGKMSVKCAMLCQPTPLPRICGPGTMLVLTPKEVSKSPQCYCEEGSCVNTGDICRMAAEPGSCYAAFRRWHYNPTSQKCEKFIYGGCEGNPNNFLSNKECHEACVANNMRSPDPVPPNPSKVVTISGKINLSEGVGTLPNPSCASVKLIDQTAKKVHTSSSTFSVSGMDISEGIPYKILCSRADLHTLSKAYTLTAVINVGWCKNQYSSDWIREDDYVTKRTYDVLIDGSAEAEYNFDIDVVPI